jgi:hypothetical protein
MKPTPCITRARLDQSDWHCPPSLAAGVAAASLAVLYFSGANRNLLYLSLWAAGVVSLAPFVRRPWVAVGGTVIGLYLAAISSRVPAIVFVDPAHYDPSKSLHVDRIGDGQTWDYHFKLRNPVELRNEAALVGYLNIDGLRLSEMEITIQGQPISTNVPHTNKYGLDHLAIPVTFPLSSDVTVSLGARPNGSPQIYVGPESHGFDIYSDAVWLEFEGGHRRVIYQAKRSVSSKLTR